MRTMGLLVVIVSVFCGAAGVQADYYVAQTNQTPTSPYTNWTDAASNIQDVVAVGADNSTIWVGAGHYKAPPSPPEYQGTNVVVMDGIRFNIRGASGDPADVIIDGESKYRGFVARYTTWDVEKRGYLFEGITVSNCVTAENGGAIRFENGGSPDRSWTGRVQNCVFSHNTADLGGAIYFRNGRSTSYPGLIVSNCLLRHNQVTSGGAALWTYLQVETHVIDSRLEHNQSDGSSGAMYAFKSDVLIDRCVFQNNRTDGDNGCVFLYSSFSDVRNSLMHDNYAAAKGLINFHDKGRLNVANCTLVSNDLGTAGAVNLRAYNGGTATVVNCVIYSNAGWAVAGTEGEVYMTNSCAPSTNKIPDFYAAGNITNNPRFADFSGRDFRLRGSSPCLNTGTNLPWTADALDLDGYPRRDTVMGLVDMGCYERPYRGTLITVQ